MMELQAWWWHRQGLGGRLVGSPATDVLATSGWARAVGGAGPYLSLHARSGALRGAIDQNVADLAIHELPSVRGCSYVVPASDYPLALKVAQGFADAEMATARKLGVTDAEVDTLGQRVVEILRDGPLEPAEIRAAAGEAVRNLGDAGRQRGLTTTLPLALGRLQLEGKVRRIPTNGRLDHQRYRYALWRPNPLRGARLSNAAAYTELARRYFAWTAPATLAEFQWFSGLGLKAAIAAVEPLALVPIEPGHIRLLPPELRPAFAKFHRPPDPEYALVSNVDAILLLRRNLPSLVGAEDAPRLGPNGGLSDLPSHAILDRGRVIGLWEFDPDTGSIAWMTFREADAALRELVARTAAWVRDDLGDVRSFSLDSPKSRAPRLAALRAGRVPE